MSPSVTRSSWAIAVRPEWAARRIRRRTAKYRRLSHVTTSRSRGRNQWRQAASRLPLGAEDAAHRGRGRGSSSVASPGNGLAVRGHCDKHGDFVGFAVPPDRGPDSA